MTRLKGVQYTRLAPAAAGSRMGVLWVEVCAMEAPAVSLSPLRNTQATSSRATLSRLICARAL